MLTTTIRALKYHGDADLNSLTTENIEALIQGLPNLEKHLENISKFNVSGIIAINKFSSDIDAEINVVKDFAESKGVEIALANVWAKGGEGAIELAEKVIDIVESNSSNFKPLYHWETLVKNKIETIATEIYGAEYVDYTAKAKAQVNKISNLGLNHLPVFIAKTQKSLSDNPKLLGRPKDFIITIRDIEIAAGAGFLIPITSDIMRMHGLPVHPASEYIDINDDDEITGLF